MQWTPKPIRTIIDLADGRCIGAAVDFRTETLHWVVCHVEQMAAGPGAILVERLRLLDHPADVRVYGTSLTLLLEAASSAPTWVPSRTAPARPRSRRSSPSWAWAKGTAVWRELDTGGDIAHLETGRLDHLDAEDRARAIVVHQPPESDLLPVEVTLQHRKLVAQRQDFSILVVIAGWQKPQQCEHVRDAQVRQSKQHEAASSRSRPPIDKGCCLERAKIGQLIRKGSPDQR